MSSPKRRVCLLCGRRARAMKKVDGQWVCRNTTACVMRRCEQVFTKPAVSPFDLCNEQDCPIDNGYCREMGCNNGWKTLGRLDGAIQRPVVRFYDAQFNEVK